MKTPIIQLKCDIQNSLTEWVSDRQKELEMKVGLIPKPEILFDGNIDKEKQKSYRIKYQDMEREFNQETYEILMQIKGYLKSFDIDVDKYKTEHRI